MSYMYMCIMQSNFETNWLYDNHIIIQLRISSGFQFPFEYVSESTALLLLPCKFKAYQ